MTPELIGKISGVIVLLSGVVYILQTFRGRSQPNLASWTIWAILGFAIWINYRESGAKDNVWPAFFGMINPIAIALLAWWKGSREKLSASDKACLILGIISIIIWWHLKKEGATKALYIAIIADLCGAYPTAKLFSKKPWEDRPLMWILFAVGYALGIFAIPDNERTLTNYILPIYMVTMSSILSWLLVRYRLHVRDPFSEWY